MALDHANHFVAQKHSSGEYWGGPFPDYSEALPFITRLLTHLAAPGFFFLMGVGMALFTERQAGKQQSRLHLMVYFWIRGSLLIALQFLIVNLAWKLSPDGWGPRIYIGVLFALGGTMIISSFLLWLRPAYLLLLAFVFFLGTEIVHPDPAAWAQLMLTDVHRLFLHPGGDLRLWSNYPILPWLELVLFGLAFGKLLWLKPASTYRKGTLLGTAMLVLFATIRAINGFGNIRPMSGTTWIGFLNVVKYPPSWTFTLLTMGVNLILLGLLNKLATKQAFFLRPLVIYGRAPLFFYVVHLFLYAGIGLLFTPEGTSIPRMLPYWLLGLLILLPLCASYSRLKRSNFARPVLRYF
jgi:uncharacterized membrane protein